MSQEKLYLKGNIAVKPLIHRWVAREALVPPASLAMMMRHAYNEYLKSYLTAPEYHVKASNTPSMIGGPWVNVPVERKEEVRSFLEQTEKEQAHLLDLADELKKLTKFLDEEAHGYSLEPLYPKLPPALRGYVELVYDAGNRPSYRLLEGLLYRSKYFDRSLQSLALTPVDQDARPFQWTTPWMPDDRHVHIEIPFDDPGIDALFSMKTEPRSFGEIREILGLDSRYEELFRSFLTDEAPRKTPRYDGDGVRLRYFGHACNLIESRKVAIMSDPIVSYEYPTDLARFTFNDIPERIDYAIITHAHIDHIYFETILQLRHKIDHLVVARNGGGTVIDPQFKLMLEQVGFRNVIELGDLESVEFDGGRITALPFFGEHGDLDIQSKAAHLVELEGHSILCAADSNNVEPEVYRRVHDLLGDIDVLFLGMECSGAPISMIYGAFLTARLNRKDDQSRRTTGSDYDRAMALAERFNLSQAYVYAMGLEPWVQHILPLDEEGRDNVAVVHSDRFVESCRAKGITAERLYAQKEVHLPGGAAAARSAA